MKTILNHNRGFTLIELVMVIVILGILSAVAIPKFVDLSGNAQKAAVQGVAGALGSADAINYAGCSVLDNVVTAGKCIAVAKCSDIGAAITPPVVFGAAGAAITNTYNLLADTAVGAPNGTQATCTLQYRKSGVTYTATYAVTSSGN